MTDPGAVGFTHRGGRGQLGGDPTFPRDPHAAEEYGTAEAEASDARVLAAEDLLRRPIELMTDATIATNDGDLLAAASHIFDQAAHRCRLALAELAETEEDQDERL